MQDDEKKHGEGADTQFDVKARVTINKGYTLPLAKLCVSGTMLKVTTCSRKCIKIVFF